MTTAADGPAGVAATVTATVALPLDVAVDVGAEVVFEGSVATFDHFARTLVVLDARLAGPPG